MVLSGHVKNNVIYLDKPIKLPDGTKVSISLPEHNAQANSGLCGIWEDNRSADEIANEIISSRSKGREIKI